LALQKSHASISKESHIFCGTTENFFPPFLYHKIELSNFKKNTSTMRLSLVWIASLASLLPYSLGVEPSFSPTEYVTNNESIPLNESVSVKQTDSVNQTADLNDSFVSVNQTFVFNETDSINQSVSLNQTADSNDEFVSVNQTFVVNQTVDSNDELISVNQTFLLNQTFVVNNQTVSNDDGLASVNVTDDESGSFNESISFNPTVFVNQSNNSTLIDYEADDAAEGGVETIVEDTGNPPPPQEEEEYNDILPKVNMPLCNKFYECYKALVGEPLDLGDVDKKEFCVALLYYFEGAKGINPICTAIEAMTSKDNDNGNCADGRTECKSKSMSFSEDGQQSSFFTSSAFDQSSFNTKNYATPRQVDPTCLEKADVEYADDSGDNTGYDLVVASIEGTYLDNGKRERSNDDDVAGLLIGYYASLAIVAALEACGGFFEDVCGLIRGAAAVVLSTFEITLNQIDFHDSGIDSSEIAATLANAETLVEQTCTMLELLLVIEEGVEEANEKLDKLLCPWGPSGVTFCVAGQGCDGHDQNCDSVVDECSEDNVPPTLTLTRPIPDTPFRNVADARQFLMESIVASDDCACNLDTTYTLQSGVDCCDCIFRVTTVDTRCFTTVAATPSATSSELFTIKVDSEAPSITCGFFTQQDPHHVAGGFDPCEGDPVPYPGLNDPLHIDANCVGHGLFDVGLWYQIEVWMSIAGNFS
jgi:hypothetical protein